MTIASPAFRPGYPIPVEYSKHGDNKSPPLVISGVTKAAKSLVLIVDDPDAPAGLWTHWLVWNISPDTTAIDKARVPSDAFEGTNSFYNMHYDGPAPPSGTHRYFFHLYALNTKLGIARGAARAEIESAMQGHVVGTAQLYGTYSADP